MPILEFKVSKDNKLPILNAFMADAKVVVADEVKFKPVLVKKLVLLIPKVPITFILFSNVEVPDPPTYKSLERDNCSVGVVVPSPTLPLGEDRVEIVMMGTLLVVEVEMLQALAIKLGMVVVDWLLNI